MSWAIGIPICHRAFAQTMCVSQTKVTPERWSTTKDTLSNRPHNFSNPMSTTKDIKQRLVEQTASIPSRKVKPQECQTLCFPPSLNPLIQSEPNPQATKTTPGSSNKDHSRVRPLQGINTNVTKLGRAQGTHKTCHVQGSRKFNKLDRNQTTHHKQVDPRGFIERSSGVRKSPIDHTLALGKASLVSLTFTRPLS